MKSIMAPLQSTNIKYTNTTIFRQNYSTYFANESLLTIFEVQPV